MKKLASQIKDNYGMSLGKNLAIGDVLLAKGGGSFASTLFIVVDVENKGTVLLHKIHLNSTKSYRVECILDDFCKTKVIHTLKYRSVVNTKLLAKADVIYIIDKIPTSSNKDGYYSLPLKLLNYLRNNYDKR